MAQALHYRTDIDPILLTENYSLFRFPLSSLDYDSFTEFPYFWWPCQFWEILVMYIIGCPSFEICMIFFWLDEVRDLGEEDHRNKVPLPSNRVTGALATRWMTVDTAIDPLAEAVCVGFPHSEAGRTCSLPRPHSVEESCYAQPTTKEWGVTFLLLKGRVST